MGQPCLNPLLIFTRCVNVVSTSIFISFIGILFRKYQTAPLLLVTVHCTLSSTALNCLLTLKLSRVLKTLVFGEVFLKVMVKFIVYAKTCIDRAYCTQRRWRVARSL